MHTHTLYFSHLYISPKKKNKKEKEKKKTELTLRQACACSEKKKKKERKKNSLFKFSCMLLTRAYIYIYYFICACISTSLLLLIDCSSSHLFEENCLYLDWSQMKRKKEKRIELRGISARNSRGNSSEAKGVLESRKLFVRGADNFCIIFKWWQTKAKRTGDTPISP